MQLLFQPRVSLPARHNMLERMQLDVHGCRVWLFTMQSVLWPNAPIFGGWTVLFTPWKYIFHRVLMKMLWLLSFSSQIKKLMFLYQIVLLWPRNAPTFFLSSKNAFLFDLCPIWLHLHCASWWRGCTSKNTTKELSQCKSICSTLLKLWKGESYYV